MTQKSIVIATHNFGKRNEIAAYLMSLSITSYSLDDLGIHHSVPEEGKTIEENAIQKVNAYAAQINNTMYVLADDSGIEIDSLQGEPGYNVRTWKGYRMSDDEIIACCLDTLKGIPYAKRTARFRTIIALSLPNNEIKTFEGTLEGYILESELSGKERREGFPFDTLFYVSEASMTLGEMRALSLTDKQAKGIQTHREKALNNLVKYFQENNLVY